MVWTHENWGDAKRYTAAGYAMVAQDCRGRGKSEGAWDPFRYDVEDGFDTQEWVGRQPWCNGDIGTAGGSYVGWTQWACAPNASRHLRAMVPVVPFGNMYDEADAALKLDDLQFRWFEYWLKGRESGVQDWPAYYLFVMGENRWRSEHEWPLQRTQFTPYYLHSSGRANSLQGDGSLSTAKSGEEKPDTFS